MPVFSVLRDYLVWHYSAAYVDIVYIWWNYLWFVNHLFAVPDVMKSWIAPFKRLEEGKVNILRNPSDFFANIFVNIMMRIVGFIIRTAIIFFALSGFVLVIGVGLSFLLFWTGLPLLVVHLFIIGFGAFFA